MYFAAGFKIVRLFHILTVIAESVVTLEIEIKMKFNVTVVHTPGSSIVSHIPTRNTWLVVTIPFSPF